MRDKLSLKVFQNKDLIKLFQNIFFLGLSSSINLLIPILLIPILIGRVGINNYGKYLFIYSIIFYILYITQYGFSLTAVRDISKHKNDNLKIQSIFNNVFNCKIIIFILCTFILSILMIFLKELRNEYILLLSMMFIIIGDILNPTWFFLGIEKMKFITLIDIFSKISFGLLAYIFIKDEDDYIYIGAYQAIGYIVSGILSYKIAIKLYNIKFKIYPLKHTLNELKKNFAAFFTLVLPLLYVNASTIIMGFYGYNKHITYFDTAYKISNGFVNINQIITNALYPYVNRKKDVFFISSIFLIICGLLMSISSYLLSEYIIIKIFGNNLLYSAFLLKILCFSPLLLSIRSAFGINYLMVTGKDKLYMYIAIFSSLFAFFIGFFIIEKYKSLGAAIVVVLAQGIFAFSSLYFALKLKRNEK